MLRMDHYPYSRFWAIWDDQDLVAVVVYKKGATELLRRLQAHAPPPPSTGAAAPAAPTAAERPGARRRTVQGSRRLAQGSYGARLAATHGRVPAVPCVALDETDAWDILPWQGVHGRHPTAPPGPGEGQGRLC